VRSNSKETGLRRGAGLLKGQVRKVPGFGMAGDMRTSLETTAANADELVVGLDPSL